MEFVQYGDLRAVLRACKKKSIMLNVREKLTFARQIASGMEFMSAMRYCHRDLATRNCILHKARHIILLFIIYYIIPAAAPCAPVLPHSQRENPHKE